MNEEVTKEEKGWFKTLLSYAEGSGGRLATSVIFSMISLVSGLIPYFCLYRIIDRYIAGNPDKAGVLHFCLIALVSYFVKVLCFGISTGIRMDITQCPYNRYFTELGTPELTKIFCINDECTYGDIPGLEFIRHTTLGTGGDKCDFYIRVKKQCRA